MADEHAPRMKTEGLHPKTIAATLAPLIPGIVLVIVGAVIGDHSVIWAGVGLLGGGGVAGAAAYNAPAAKYPGQVYKADEHRYSDADVGL